MLDFLDWKLYSEAPDSMNISLCNRKILHKNQTTEKQHKIKQTTITITTTQPVAYFYAKIVSSLVGPFWGELLSKTLKLTLVTIPGIFLVSLFS